MHRPILALLMCVTMGGCSRSAPPADAPAPAPEPTTTSAPVTPSATAPVLAPAGTVREYRGAYTRGFEASWFVPCDAGRDDALWWVTLTEDARLQRDSLLKTLTRPATGALAVRWRGTISERMPAGQMGRGTRYMLVHQVLEVRPLPPEGACGVVSRTSSAYPRLNRAITVPSTVDGSRRTVTGG
jgi:hypothetical protein